MIKMCPFFSLFSSKTTRSAWKPVQWVMWHWQCSAPQLSWAHAYVNNSAIKPCALSKIKHVFREWEQCHANTLAIQAKWQDTWLPISLSQTCLGNIFWKHESVPVVGSCPLAAPGELPVLHTLPMLAVLLSGRHLPTRKWMEATHVLWMCHCLSSKC